MTAPVRTSPLRARAVLETRYAATLRKFLRGKNQSNGDQAQGLGRAALACGWGTLDLALVHDEAFAQVVETEPLLGGRARYVQRGDFFLTQALMPLEAAERANRKSLLDLHRRNRTLREHTAALEKSNRQLEREVKRRKASEESVRRGKAQYQKLFTESHVLQRKLRRLTRQIISAQEDERKKISRDLHDHVVQNLVGINVQLSALSHEAGADPSVLKEKIARTQRLVETSVNTVHQFARELRPAVLDDLGLIPALHSFSKDLAARQKLKIQLTAFSGVEDLENAKRTVLYRVAQEALTNVVRHAGASQATVLITALPGAVRMEIRDDGKSFPVDKTLCARTYRRLGLVGMQERMEMIGGTLTIVSTPGKGTTVRAELPFSSSASKP